MSSVTCNKSQCMRSVMCYHSNVINICDMSSAICNMLLVICRKPLKSCHMSYLMSCTIFHNYKALAADFNFFLDRKKLGIKEDIYDSWYK